MDVAALHQGFLRQLRDRGGVLALRSRTGRIERRNGKWHVETAGGDVFVAPMSWSTPRAPGATRWPSRPASPRSA